MKPTAQRKPGETLRPLLRRELQRAAKPTAVGAVLTAMEKFLSARAAGNLPAARRALDKAKQAAPRSASVREALGLLAFDGGEWHHAAQELLAFRRLTGEHRHDPLIAECYMQQGKTIRALEFLDELHPKELSTKTWAAARAVRAQALALTGRTTEAIDFLTYEISRERNERSRATLAEARAGLQ